VKQEVNPVVVAIVIIVVAAAAFFFVWHKANAGAGAKAPGQQGNPGPFTPGSPIAINGSGGSKAGTKSSGMPGAPR